MITIKLLIKNKDVIKNNILPYLQQYNNVVRFAYNRFYENRNLITKDILIKVKELNNIHLLDASILKNAIEKGIEIYKTSSVFTNKSIVFGGKQNFINYNNKLKTTKSKEKRLILKQEYKENKLHPFNFIGGKYDKGNRKFKLNVENSKVIFKPCRNIKIDILLPKLKTKIKENLLLLQELCSLKQTYFNCSFDLNYIYISFNEEILKPNEQYDFKENRILSLDLNPNYIAYSICDYNKLKRKNIIQKEIISLKEINSLEYQQNYKNSINKSSLQKYFTNKRNFELLEISKYIIKKAKYYKCESLVIEDLNIKSKDNGSKVKNKLWNNKWNRNLLINNLSKRCNIEGIHFQKVLTFYSSFIGQIQNEKEYDSIAASLEIGRRGNLFIRQYVKKENLLSCTKDKSVVSCKQKIDVVYPIFKISNLPVQWKKHVKLVKTTNKENWISFYNSVKNLKMSYRFLFNENKTSLNFLRLKNTQKSRVKLFVV